MWAQAPEPSGPNSSLCSRCAEDKSIKGYAGALLSLDPLRVGRTSISVLPRKAELLLQKALCLVALRLP